VEAIPVDDKDVNVSRDVCEVVGFVAIPPAVGVDSTAVTHRFHVDGSYFLYEEL